MQYNKNSVIIFLVTALLIVTGIILLSSGSRTDTQPQVPNTSDSESGGATTNTPATLTTYSLADVAMHATAESCWSAVNGGVYDLTSWISQHPGGSRAILGICGKDGSAVFSAQHGGQQRPEDTLATFKIGTLTQ